MTRRKPRASSAAPAAAGRPPRILVVDDYADNREMYASFLEFSGLRVEEAESGNEALAKALASPPDLIVMDLSLPGVDGWQATRVLKSDPRTKQIPIVVVTGHALEGSLRRAREAGCDSFLKKPCLPEDLLAEIRRVLSGEPVRPIPKTRR
jgi:CheY-like chemotaxis protein